LYIKYPYIFYDCLYSYIAIETSSLVITNDGSIGVYYLFVLEVVNMFNDTATAVSEISRISDLFRSKCYNSNSRGIYPRMIKKVDLLKYSFPCPFCLELYCSALIVLIVPVFSQSKTT
jgi:hypothetical protein